MQKILLLLAGTLAVAFSSCVPENNTVEPTQDAEKSLSSFLDGSINFALEMFRSLHIESPNASNLFYSPLSVWVALATLYAGSKQQTAKELAAVLGIKDMSTSIAPVALNAFMQACDSCEEHDKPTLRIANRIYFQEDLEFKLCGKYLDEILHRIDFKSDPEKARESINDFIEKETNGKIQELLPPLSVSAKTDMIIANAVYFKGTWRNQFNPNMTRSTRFYQDLENTIFVDMMTTAGSYLYSVSDQMDCQAVEIPYEGDTVSMVILLPKHKYVGMNTLAKTITPKRLDDVLNSMTYREVLLSLPKFKSEQKYELTHTLQKMGIRNLFDPRFADLSGFADTIGLSVDGIHHKSYIKVNEEGTEAAAATGDVLSRVSRPQGITRFVADRPFLYIIRDLRSGSLLFMGTIMSPKYY